MAVLTRVADENDTERMTMDDQEANDSAEAAAVICLHPLALSGAMWTQWAAPLARSRRVEALDFRGHGFSLWDGEQYTIWDLADDVRDIATNRGMSRVHLVGASMGGCVAIAIAARHPELVASLSLMDTTAWYGESAPKDWAERAERALLPRKEQLSWQLERWFTPEFVRSGDPILDEVSEIFLRTKGPAHAAACRAIGSFDGRAAAQEISAPTIILTGQDDSATPVEMGQQLAELIPNAEFCVVPNARHFSFLESPLPLEAVKDHLRSIRL